MTKEEAEEVIKYSPTAFIVRESHISGWYSKEEIFHCLKRLNYSDKIGGELSEIWVNDLNGAFNKGKEIASRELQKEIDTLKSVIKNDFQFQSNHQGYVSGLLAEIEDLKAKLKEHENDWIDSKVRMPDFDGYYYIFGHLYHECGNITEFYKVGQCHMNKWVKEPGEQFTYWRNNLHPPKIQEL